MTTRARSAQPSGRAARRGPSISGSYLAARQAFETSLRVPTREAVALWRAERCRSGATGGQPRDSALVRGQEAEALGPLWGWCACDRCGDTIVLGEPALRVGCREGVQRVCLACAGRRR